MRSTNLISDYYSLVIFLILWRINACISINYIIFTILICKYYHLLKQLKKSHKTLLKLSLLYCKLQQNSSINKISLGLWYTHNIG